MARRIRTIKPEVLEDQVVGTLGHLEWRLFVSLWVLADDYGNLRGHPAMIQGNALWGCGVSVEETQAAIDSLDAKGLVLKYEVRNQQYLHVCGWEKHQRVDKPGKPLCPAPLEDSRDSRENSREPRETLATDRDLEGKGREGSESLAPPPLALVPSEPKAKRPGEHQQAVDAFHQAYKRQNAVAPTWDGKATKIIADLVKAHGSAEVQRRIEILFLGQGPPWIQPPFDVGTLRQHFDKLASPTKPQNRNQPTETYQRRPRLDQGGS